MPEPLLPVGDCTGARSSPVCPPGCGKIGWDLGDEAGLYWSLQHGGKLPRRGLSPQRRSWELPLRKAPCQGQLTAGPGKGRWPLPAPSSCSPPTEQRRGRRGTLCPAGSRLFPAVWPVCVHVFVCLYTHVCACACSLRCTSLCTSEFWLEPLLVGHRSCHPVSLGSARAGAAGVGLVVGDRGLSWGPWELSSASVLVHVSCLSLLLVVQSPALRSLHPVGCPVSGKGPGTFCRCCL